MLTSLLLIAAGLVFLVGGANVLIRGASALAIAFGVPPVVVGMTVVAFGTSAPELVVNSVAAVRGETGLAFGSIVGSCVINIGWVLTVTALVRPLTVEVTIITREIPMMILAVAAWFALAADRLDGAPADQLGHGDGALLLLLFCVFLYYTFRSLYALPRHRDDQFVDNLADTIERRKTRPKSFLVLGSLAGLVAVAVGARLTVSAAVDVAHHLGVPDVIIGLTIVSLGTTLPELLTGILAVRRGESDLAIGNVVGSNIFNLLFIGGTASAIRPIPIPPGGYLDLLVLAAFAVILLPIAIRGPRRITRAEATLLLSAYLSYATWRALSATTAG